MDDEVRTRFKEVFEAIRQEFKIVFPNMFGGGKAELVLTEPTDLLKKQVLRLKYNLLAKNCKV